ncbi:ribosome maturation factor RimM [Svornostia abyssi]|uniref:Ribosome maturation factor RimM n=1 Tax=Svornostia abyssi TaxID=2898438 RepID=A0ABY5PC66_9ACTN|nr:ribosome maturation factor RimM [Parviterribacteraceae bacterium J379]
MTERAVLLAGRVGRPHGLDGSFHVTRPRAGLLRVGVTVRLGERTFEIVRAAGTDDRPILRLDGVAGREAVEALRGTDLYVAREEAPALADDEYWAEDLEGCVVTDGDRELGRVARLVALPSCEALEMAGSGVLIPLVRDAVRTVDIAAGRIDVNTAFLGDLAP